MSRVVCVWLPNWPLQRLRHERSELKARPVVIYSTAGRRGAGVVTCSPAAARQGVVANMPLAEAQALCATHFGCITAIPKTCSPGPCGLGDSRKQPNRPSHKGSGYRESTRNCCYAPAHFERHDPAADVAALREQARMCEAFSPLFGIEPADSPECVWLDVAGCSHLWGGEQNLADAVADKFRRRGFQTRVALAPTIGAAWAAAHFLAKANEQPVLGESQLATALAPLPVTALRLPFKTIETLHELGLRQIGQLRALPRASLPSRLGTALLQRLDQAFGDAPELLIPECPPEPIEATWAAEDSLADRESLRFVCRELLDQLLNRLTPRREGVRQLLCQIKGAETRPLELVVNLVSPSNVGPHLLELLSLQFERTALPEAVSFVRLEATAIASLAARPRDLFGFESDGDGHREVAGLLDRLSSRLGSQAVVRARLLPEAQPELAVAYEPCVVASGADSFPSPLGQGTTTSRPLRLFAPPQPIEVSIAGPEGAPLRFRWERREHRVLRSWGPERIETGWWRDESVHRDYFRVEVHTGQRFWLFRCLKELAWFIHGAFD